MNRSSSIEIRRRLSAPVAEVFRWWTEPDLIEMWMTPAGEVEASIDLRAGGAFRIVMRGAGMVIEHVGTFLEVDRPRRLMFTWSSPYTGPRPGVVTVELEPAGDDGTDLRLVHAELPEEVAPSHAGGWGAMLARLEGMLSARTEVEVPDGD